MLRRPPRPPLPPSAHDMVREARLQLALAPQGIRLPPILAVCEDESVLGVPFYVMGFLDGHVVTDRLPAGLEDPAARSRARRGARSTRWWRSTPPTSSDPALAAFARPGSYLERQVRRFSQLWEINATREIPDVEEVGAAPCRRAAGAAAGFGRPRRLPAREPHGRAGPSRPRRRQSSTGRWERSAIRAPTSATCSRRTPSPAAARARSVSRRSPRWRDSRRRCSWSRATRSEAGARSGRSAGSRRSRSGRPPSSARRSTAATHGASSAPRTRAPPRFEQAVPLMAETAAAALD